MQIDIYSEPPWSLASEEIMDADENKPILDYENQVCYYTANPDTDKDHFEKNNCPNSKRNTDIEITAKRVTTTDKINCKS